MRCTQHFNIMRRSVRQSFCVSYCNCCPHVRGIGTYARCIYILRSMYNTLLFRYEHVRLFATLSSVRERWELKQTKRRFSWWRRRVRLARLAKDQVRVMLNCCYFSRLFYHCSVRAGRGDVAIAATVFAAVVNTFAPICEQVMPRCASECARHTLPS